MVILLLSGAPELSAVEQPKVFLYTQVLLGPLHAVTAGGQPHHPARSNQLLQRRPLHLKEHYHQYCIVVYHVAI